MQDFCVIFIYILQYRNAVEIPRLMVISCFVLCLVNMAQIGPSGILNCLPEPQCGVKWPSQIRAGNLLIRSFFLCESLIGAFAHKKRAIRSK